MNSSWGKTLMHPDLYSPIELGNLQLSNRIWMAPMTRCRASADHHPTSLMATYYAQRATAGLIIAEATMVVPYTSAYGHEPGLYSPSQVEEWRKVTQAVHQNGGQIVLQLWHGGRACHPSFNDGQQPVAASPLSITSEQARTPEGYQPYARPRELTVQEIDSIISAFQYSARLAGEAGFDGVEIHAANGYLLDTFLRDGSNHRTDQYGGTLSNRARFLLETIRAVAEEMPVVGLRISPLNSYNDMSDSDPVGLTTWLAQELNHLPLTYLHVMRSDFLSRQTGDILSTARTHFKSTLVANMGYSRDEADAAVQAGTIDACAFGTQYISNPTLPSHFKNNLSLATPKQEYFYAGGPVGYTDYS